MELCNKSVIIPVRFFFLMTDDTSCADKHDVHYNVITADCLFSQSYLKGNNVTWHDK